MSVVSLDAIACGNEVLRAARMAREAGVSCVRVRTRGLRYDDAIVAARLVEANTKVHAEAIPQVSGRVVVWAWGWDDDR